MALITAWPAEDDIRSTSPWVANVDATVRTVEAGARRVPVLLDGPRARRNSYVAGAHASWLDYALDEALGRGTPWQQRVARTTAWPLRAVASAALHAAGFGACAWIDNPLFSTQLPAPGIAATVPAVDAWLRGNAVGRLGLWRNVCRDVDADLYAALRHAGWTLLPARRVYLCDPQDASLWKRNHVKRDQRLMRDGEAQWVEHAALRPDDLPALRACFRAVFIDKHSRWNPDFTPGFFERQLQRGPLELLALRVGGRPAGILGLYAQGGWLTTPLIGYDTSAPPALGLYRRLMARLLHEARERGLRLHYSSGAGDFKANRGGEPVLEYTAAQPGTLPAARRALFSALSALLRRSVPPVLERFA